MSAGAAQLRKGSRRPFTMVDRSTINRPDLSYRALGVLVWMLDKPDGWVGFSAERLAIGESREGRDAIRAAIRELESLGYVEHERRQVDGGRWVTDTIVYDHPDRRDAVDERDAEGPAGDPPPTTGFQASVDQRGTAPPTPGLPVVGRSGHSPFIKTEKKEGPAEQRPRTDERRDGPTVVHYHPDDEERTRVRANLAAFRAGIGMGRSPHEKDKDATP